jgi:hypothetical protein
MGTKSRTIVISPDSLISRPDKININNGELTLQLTYDSHGNIASFYFYGDKETFPSDTDLLKIVTEINAIWNPKTSPAHMMDQGTIVSIGAAFVKNATTLIYTVPAGRTFYVFQYDLDLSVAAIAVSNNNYGILGYTIPTSNIALYIAELFSIQGTSDKHTQGSFNFLSLPAGSKIYIGSTNANVDIAGNMLGVLI